MWVIAHRGASGHAPENTRAAFDRAIEMGASAIETDVRMTRDGQLVLLHDLLVDRTTDGSGPVDDYTLDELRGLDAGSWFGPKFAGQRVLTLDETVAEYLERIPFLFEIKDARVTRPLVEALIARGAVARATVTSFFWYPLLEARDISPDLTLAFITPAPLEVALVDRVARRGFNQIGVHISQVSQVRVQAAHDRGLAVRAWGIDQRVQVERLYETGVDGATINWPGWMLEGAGDT